MPDVSETSDVPDAPDDNTLRAILSESRCIAIVGLSPQPQRASHQVAHYLQTHGYRIVPINPQATGCQILGQPVHPSLGAAARALTDQGLRIAIVDCFRSSEHIAPLASQAIAIAARCLWLQLGVRNQAAAQQARVAGLQLVQDRCIKTEHARLFGSAR